VRGKTGFTLVELVVVLAILGVIGAAMGALLLHQQRFYRGVSELLYARQGVRDAMEVLASDLRGISVADTARLLADSAIEVFAPIGGSAVCQGGGVAEVGLPAASPSDNTLTWFLSQPDTGDLALFYQAGVANAGRWERHRITGFASRSLASACPASAGLARDEDVVAGRQGFQVDLDAPLSGGVLPGAPVRFVRRGRYSLYRASDGDWYLGYRRCNAIGSSACGAIQPLSGPYRSYSSNSGTSGLVFEYFDSHGARLDPSMPLDLARIDISARAESRHHLGVEGHSFTPSDSATVSIAIRNRPR
jgi:prepilin-type N-terminal cleavage/methylation domain-containing protein